MTFQFLQHLPGVLFKMSCDAALMFVFVIGLYFIYKSCTMFTNSGYFNAKSALYLKRGGYILAAKALLGFVKMQLCVDAADLAVVDYKANLFAGISSNITLFIIGFSLTAISDIIKTGSEIKQENDLTI